MPFHLLQLCPPWAWERWTVGLNPPASQMLATFFKKKNPTWEKLNRNNSSISGDLEKKGQNKWKFCSIYIHNDFLKLNYFLQDSFNSVLAKILKFQIFLRNSQDQDFGRCGKNDEPKALKTTSHNNHSWSVDMDSKHRQPLVDWDW